MIPRPPKSPNRNGVLAGMCPAVSATAAVSVPPNSLPAARACTRGSARPPRCTSQRQALIAVAAAWVFQTKFR
eukprot:6376658-Pyramimonas_sp.AAC.1